MDIDATTLPDIPTPTPFAGRTAVFERLHATLTAREGRALLIVGRRGVGKTALLHHVGAVLDSNTIPVYLALIPDLTTNETTLLRALHETIVATLVVYALPVERLSIPPTHGPDLLDWLVDVALPEITKLVRSGRRLVLLLDDAHHLIDAHDTAPDLPRSLHALIQPQVGIALTVAQAYDDRLEMLLPLAEPTEAVVLRNLTRDESRDLLAVAGVNATDHVATTVHRMSGGLPELAQAYLHALDSSAPPYDAATLKTVSGMVYSAEDDGVLRRLWAEREPNERRVLHALAELVEADPIRPVTAARIATWLVETEHPLDTTAVAVAVRGLEYDELITQTPEGLRLTVGLMQRWLLDHAGEQPGLPARATSPPAPDQSRRLWLTVALVVVAIMLVVLLLASGGTPSPTGNITPQPTVTLAVGV